MNVIKCSECRHRRDGIDCYGDKVFFCGLLEVNQSLGRRDDDFCSSGEAKDDIKYKELLDVFNDYSSAEFDDQPMTLDEMLEENEIGLMYGSADEEETILLQYSYNIKEQMFKGYIITNGEETLVSKEDASIEDAIDCIRGSDYQGYYSFMMEFVDDDED